MTSKKDSGHITVWVIGMTLLIGAVGAASLSAWSAFAEKRELTAAADQAAQAGATALDIAVQRTTAVRQLDPGEAEARAWESLAQQELGEVSNVVVHATPEQIVVTVETQISTGLLSAFDDQPYVISATAIGSPRQEDP